MNRRTLLCLALALAGVQASAQTPPGKESPRVLLLYEFDRLLPANMRFEEGFRKALGEAYSGRYELFAEFLDMVRFPGEERAEAMAASLRVRYHERPPQVMVAVGKEALTFLQSRRDSLFPGVPVAFGGVGEDGEPLVNLGPDVVGQPMSLEIAPIVELAVRLRPQTREVVVVTGSAHIDREWNRRARAEFRPFEPRLTMTYWNEVPFAELTQKASGLGQDAVVIYLTYLQEPDGTPLPSSARALELLAAKCAAPIFGPYDTYLGKGIVGGVMSDFEGEGAAVARLVQRVLSGEDPEKVGVQPPRPGLVCLDARQLARWGIPQSNVPADSTVRFREPSLWETHRTAVLATLGIVLAQGVLITLLLAARRRTREVDASLSLAADAASIGLWHRDSSGESFKVSPRWRAIFGLPPKGRIDLKELMTRIHDDDRERVLRAIEDAAVAGRSFALEHRVVHPDGSVRWVASHGRAEAANGSGKYDTRGATMDITERKEAETAADAQRRELALLSRISSLGVLSGALAHELNQPLGIILSNAQAAQHLLTHARPDMQELHDILTDIVMEDRRAGDVIKRLRALLRRGETAPQRVAVNGTINDVLLLTRSDLVSHGVTVQREFGKDDPEVLADRVQLQQVVLNLIMNARDAMEETPEERRIMTLATSGEGNEVRIAVRDCGIGLPEDIESVFKPFHTTKANGLGMGLAICRTLIGAHGGRLWAERNADRGATFHVALPKVKDDA